MMYYAEVCCIIVYSGVLLCFLVDCGGLWCILVLYGVLWCVIVYYGEVRSAHRAVAQRVRVCCGAVGVPLAYLRHDITQSNYTITHSNCT